MYFKYKDYLGIVYNDSTEELDKVVEKYLCIAKNGYNENASICK